MELVAGGEPFDRRYFRAIGLDGEDGTRLGAAAVDEYRAGAALTSVAADVGASEIELFTQEVDQQHPRFHVRGAAPSVNGDGNLSHMSPLG